MFIKNHQEKKKPSFFHHPFLCWKNKLPQQQPSPFSSHFFSQPKKKSPSPTPTFFWFFRGKEGAIFPATQLTVGATNPSTATVERGACWLDLRGNGAAALATPRRALDTFVVSGLDVLTGEGYLVAPRIRQGLVRFYKGYMMPWYMVLWKNPEIIIGVVWSLTLPETNSEFRPIFRSYCC